MAKLWRSLLGVRSSGVTEGRSHLGVDQFNDFSPAAFAAFKSYYQGGGIGRDRDRETIENNFTSYVTRLFKSDGIVFACMVARQLVFAEARFQFRTFTNGRPQALRDGPGLRVLEKPWPNGSSGELLARMIGDVDLSGNAYIAREGNRLRRLRPDWVQIIMTAPPDVAVQSDVAGYAYFPGGIERGKPTIYLPEEMAHWSPIPDPDASYRGMSALTPVVGEILADQAATGHKLNFFRNGAMLGPIFRLGADVSIEKFREFMAAMNAEHTGTENAYKPLYVGGGADVTLAAANMQQIDFRAVTGAGETRIAAVLRISPVIVGLSEGMQGSSLNAGNYNAAKRNFVDGTMRPLWRSACGSLETVVPPPPGDQLWYDDYDIPYLREDAMDMAQIGSAKASTIVSLSTGGFLRESAIAAVENNYDMNLLVKDPDWVSVQLQSSSGSGGPGGGPDAARRLHVEADARVVRELPGRHRTYPDDDEEWHPAEPDDYGDLSDDELNEDEQALYDALTILADQNGVDLAARSWDPSLHPRGPDGKFISTGALLAHAIQNHLSGGGGPDPFGTYSRDRLRRVARRMGVTLPRGASHDYISQALLHHVGAGMTPSVHVPQPVHVPTPRRPRTPHVPGVLATHVGTTRAGRIADALVAVRTHNPISDTMDKIDRLTDVDFATLSAPEQNEILDKLQDIQAHALRRPDIQRAIDIHDRLVQVTPGQVAPPVTPHDPARARRIADAIAQINSIGSADTKMDMLDRLSPADYQAMSIPDQVTAMAFLDDMEYAVDPVRRVRARDIAKRLDPTHVPSGIRPISQAPRGVPQAKYAQALLTTSASHADKIEAINLIDPADFQALPSAERKNMMDFLGRATGHPDPAVAQAAADAMDKHDPLARLLLQVGTVPGGNPSSGNAPISPTLTKTQADRLNAINAAGTLSVSRLNASDHALQKAGLVTWTSTPTGNGGHTYHLQATSGPAAAPTPSITNRATRQGNALAASANSAMSDKERNTHIGHLHKADYDAMTARDQQQILAGLHATAQFAPDRADRARAKKLIDRFTPAGTPLGGTMPTPSTQILGAGNPSQTILPTPQGGLLAQAANSGLRGDEWLSPTTGGGSRVWGKYGSGGLLLRHVDASGTERFLMTQRGPGISDPGKWSYPGGAFESKENFYQGATREVAEELGWTDADFAGAQVHGYHVFERADINAVDANGNTKPWTYHSVAATVPTMMTPHLSSHGAQTETSDAKWLTRAEIVDLDRKGKLHHPVAGGKLEQNVMSIFPQTTATPGGAQASPPSRLPHKPSKGRNLIPDQAAQDKFRSDISATRRSYRGKTADERLAAIGAMQGYDETPTVVKRKEFDRLLATGDYTEAWRGQQSAGGWGTPSKSAADINEEMRSGPAYYGTGIFGNGYYLTTQRSVASMYSDGTKNSIVRVLIPKSAKTEGFDSVHRRAGATSSSKGRQFTGGRHGDTGGVGTLRDPGRYAAASGLDGIEIASHHHSPGGHAVHIARPGKPSFVWLNRSVLIIQEAE